MPTEPRDKIKVLVEKALLIDFLVAAQQVENLDGLLDHTDAPRVLISPAVDRHLDDFEQAVILQKTKEIIVKDVRKALTTRTRFDIALEWFFFAAAMIATLLLATTSLLLNYDGVGTADSIVKSAVNLVGVNVVGAIRIITYGALILLVFCCITIGLLRIRNNN